MPQKPSTVDVCANVRKDQSKFFNTPQNVPSILTNDKKWESSNRSNKNNNKITHKTTGRHYFLAKNYAY